MTFPAELERLLKAYKAEANAIERFRIGQRIDALLCNHAYAILGLVRAAEDVKLFFGRFTDSEGSEETGPYLSIKGQKACDALSAALAKLNGEGK